MRGCLQEGMRPSQDSAHRDNRRGLSHTDTRVLEGGRGGRTRGWQRGFGRLTDGRGAAAAPRGLSETVRQAEPSLPDAPGLFRAWVFTSLSTDVKENEPRLQRLFSCPSFCTDVLHHEEDTPDSASVRRLWRHVEPGLNPI